MKDKMATECSFELLIMVTPTLSSLGHPQMPSVVQHRGETKSSTGWVIDEKRGGVKRVGDSGEPSGEQRFHGGDDTKGRDEKNARGDLR